MTTTIKTGNTYTFVHDDSMQVCDAGLPVGTYVVKWNEMKGIYYLERVESFEIPSKVYGKTNDRAARVLNTFMDRKWSTGVMLNGVKGSGKTLLAKQIAVMGAKQGIPTIVVNHPYGGDIFNSFIQSIDIPAIIMFDEFEKVYKYHEQEMILTLLDGVFQTKKMFIVTTNDSYAVNEHMKNRPGRIFYNFEFGTLEPDFIEEYCIDNINDKTQIPHIVQYTKVFNFFNFDMLAASVEEMNRYNETLPEVLNVLNIIPETSHDDTYKVSIVIAGQEYLLDRDYRRFTPNKFSYVLDIEDLPNSIAADNNATNILRQITGTKSKSKSKLANRSQREVETDYNDYDDVMIEFNTDQIKSFDQIENKFSYEVNKNGHVLVLQVARNVRKQPWTYSPLLE